MRERLSTQAFGSVVNRITPAYAGKTFSLFLAFALCWDHPRVCGKDLKLLKSKAITIGSPPRMRERLRFLPYVLLSCRITPAYAGKTVSEYNEFQNTRDHPRVCGKDNACRLGLCLQQGSPPRMRERRLLSLSHLA